MFSSFLNKFSANSTQPNNVKPIPKESLLPLILNLKDHTTEFRKISELQFFRYILIILLSVIIIVGIFGNVLNLLIFSKKKMRQVSTFRFLLYISMSDMLVLLIGATHFLINAVFHFDIRSYSLFVCKTHTFLTYFFTHASSVLLMVLSIERALIMCKSNISSILTKANLYSEPTRRNDENDTVIAHNTYELVDLKTTDQANSDTDDTNMDEAKKKVLNHLDSENNFSCFCLRRHGGVDFVIFIILTLLALLNLHYVLFLELHPIKSETEIQNKKSSDVVFAEYFIKKNLNVFDRFNFTGPGQPPGTELTVPPVHFICFPYEKKTYFNFLIFVWIWIDLVIYAAVPFFIMSLASAIILMQLRKRFQNYVDNSKIKNKRFFKNYNDRLKQNNQIIYMLLVNNFYFLLTLLPYCIVFGIYRGSKKESETQKLVELAVYILLYTNNAFNFLLYGITSKNYRMKFKEIFLG